MVNLGLPLLLEVERKLKAERIQFDYLPLLNNFVESFALPPRALLFLLPEFLHFNDPLDDVFLAFSSAALPVIQILKKTFTTKPNISG